MYDIETRKLKSHSTFLETALVLNKALEHIPDLPLFLVPVVVRGFPTHQVAILYGLKRPPKRFRHRNHIEEPKGRRPISTK